MTRSEQEPRALSAGAARSQAPDVRSRLKAGAIGDCPMGSWRRRMRPPALLIRGHGHE